MRYERLGRTELVVSSIAFGTWQLGGEWGPTDEAAAIAAVRAAVDAGVTLFDTAQAYGFGIAERLLAAALGTRREGIVVATKGGLRRAGGGIVRDSSPAWIRRGVDESLAALGCEALDLYQVHWPDPSVPFAETAGVLGDLVAEGKVRHVGVSNFDAAQMAEFGATIPVETLQAPYHLFHRDIEAGELPYATAHDVGVLAYSPLAHGLLTGTMGPHVTFPPGDWRASCPDFSGEGFAENLAVVGELASLAAELGVTLSQLAVAWVVSHPAVQVAIVGTRRAAHVAEAAAAGEIELDRGALEMIDGLLGRARRVVGPSPEGMPDDLPAAER